MYGKNYKNCFILCKSINLYKMSDTLVSHAEDIPINMSHFDDLFQQNNRVSWEESFKYIVVPDKSYFLMCLKVFFRISLFLILNKNSSN